MILYTIGLLTTYFFMSGCNADAEYADDAVTVFKNIPRNLISGAALGGAVPWTTLIVLIDAGSAANLSLLSLSSWLGGAVSKGYKNIHNNNSFVTGLGSGIGTSISVGGSLLSTQNRAGGWVNAILAGLVYSIPCYIGSTLGDIVEEKYFVKNKNRIETNKYHTIENKLE